MIKVDYVVKLYIGGNTDIGSVFLSGGVCQWSISTGILEDNWWGNISSNVDVSSSGNYESYSPTKIKIVKSKIVEKTLNNFGLTMIGKRVEILEVSSTTRIIYRGVVDKLTEYGNTTEINVSHLVNKYSANLTSMYGSKYSTLVYGVDVDNVELTTGSTGDGVTVGTLGSDKRYPYFRASHGTIFVDRLWSITSLYDISIVSVSDLEEFLSQSKYFLLESQNSVIATIDRSVTTKEIDGKEYATVWADIQPYMYKTQNGENAILKDEIIAVKYVDFATVLYTNNSSVGMGNVYNSDGVKIPEYIDYIEYNENSVNIIDANSRGFSFIEPERTRWANEEEMKAIFGEQYLSIGSDGVCFKHDQYGTIDSWDSSVTNGDNIGYRKSTGGDISTATSTQTGRAFESGGGAAMWTNFAVAYDIDNVSDYETLYASMQCYIDNVNGWIIGDIFSTVRVKTIRKTHDVSYSENLQVITEDGEDYKVDDFILPNEVARDNENSSFLFKSYGVTGRIWYSVDIMNGIPLEDYEKNNPMTVYYTVQLRHNTGITSAIPRTVDVTNMKVNVFSDVDFDLNDLYANNVTGKDGLFKISDIYNDVCKRQNFSCFGLPTPQQGWGIGDTTGDTGVAVNSTGILSTAPATEIKYKTDSTVTKDVKNDLLRFGCGIGFIDQNGLESWANLLSMYDSGGVNITAYDVIGVPSANGLNSNRVYCDIGITTNKGSFTISNTEQGAVDYRSEYADGFDSQTGKNLWLLGNILHKRFQVKNEYPKKLSEVDAVVDEVEYIKNQYAIAGAVSVDGNAVLYDRYTLKINLPTEFVIANDIWKGSKILFSFPNIASGHTGVITGIGKDISDEIYTIAAEMVGGIIDSTETYEIIESGSQIDNIVESGSQETNYIEVV